MAAGIALLAGSFGVGCSDPVSFPTDPLWLGRGSVLFTQGLAFDNAGTIAAINVDGSGQRGLFPGAIPCPPKGGKIVYADVAINKPWGIFLGNEDGTGVPQQLAGGAQGSESPIFGIIDLSRDASRVIYVTYNILASSSTLYVVDADGSGRRSLSNRVVSSTAALISPDGSRVAFYAGAGKNELSVADLTSGIVTVIADNARPWSIENLDWSPDGSRIAYVGVDPTDPSGARNIYIARADGTLSFSLTSDALVDNRWPTWSPDGTRIAYIRGGEVWTMLADGTSKQQVTSESPWPYQIKISPQWSPDGSMILFTALAGNGVQGLLQVVDLRTLRVNALATGAARGFWR